ncbi:MAG: hypothetical protein WCG60_02450 [bacterium]
MRNKKTKIIILVLLIIFVVLLFVRFIGPEDTWLCQNGEWIKHGNPDRSKPEETLCVNENSKILNILNDYLSKNISDISPEKEVLGGKFYITKLILISNDRAEVEYEDGHIALKADFNFIVKNGVVEIINFKLLSNK